MASTAPHISVDPQNEEEVARALKALEKQIKKDLIAEDVKPVAQRIADDAKQMVPEKLEVRSGKLVAGIKVGVGTFKSIAIRSGAKGKWSGESYPAIHEFGGRRGAEYGPRATLTPAVREHEGDVREAMSEALDKYARRHDLL